MSLVRLAFLFLFLVLACFGTPNPNFGQPNEPDGSTLAAQAADEATEEPTPEPPVFVNHSLEKSGAQVLKDRPWMNDLYSWNETFDLDHQKVKANETGAYCIGNGRAFALIGLSSPLWTWSNLYGASYQEPDLGGLRMNITRAGQEAWMPRQQIGWIKRSGLVKVKAEGNGLTAESYDFAPVTSNEEAGWNNLPVLVRVVHLVNTSDQSEDDLDIELKIQSSWNVKLKETTQGKDLVLVQSAARAKKRTVWRLGAFNSRAVKIWDNNLHYSVPSLKPGQETWAAFFLVSGNSSRENSITTSDIRETGPLAMLDKTRDYYQKWFERGTEFSGDAKITDLFEIESMIFKCQQSTTGGFSPLIGYSYTWIRDNNGPIRWFLKTGHPLEAKRAIDFFYGVASSMGTLPNSIRVDYPLNYRLKNLSTLHVEHAETPNWIVLQHWWYYLTTGNIELIRGRWTYLERCIEGQVQEEGKYFFHRDETYLWCIESRCFDHTSFPNYFLSTYAFAVDSSFDLVSAADHLAYLGKYLEMDKDVSDLKKLSEKVRKTAEDTFWDAKQNYWAPAQSLLGPLYNAPHANILINPFWCGYARNDLDPLGETLLSSQRAVDAIRNGALWLGREDGFWKTTPNFDFFVGMNPGQLLYDLCESRIAWAEKIYHMVLKTATPSGEFAEMYDGDYHPWNPPVWGLGTSGRVRPWEGGLNTESVLEYLTGFAPDAGNKRVVFSPHLPEEIKEFTAKRLLVGNNQISLSMKRTGAKTWTLNLHAEKGQPLEVVLDLWAGHRFLANVATDQTVNWEKTLVETLGKAARCRFTAEEGMDYSFVITEFSNLPNGDLNPPKPKSYEPEPYSVDPSNLLLLTSPSGVLYKHKHTSPENYLKVGRSELKAMDRVTSSVSFLDMDLPISPDDIADGLLDEKGNPKVKLALFGRGAFSSGKHHFKPVSYWADPKIAKAAKKFLNEGGCLFLGPSYPNREVLPDWLVSLTGGGWEEGTLSDKTALVDAAKAQRNQKKIDEVDIADEGSEKNHAVTYEGITFTDVQNLPDSQDEKKMIRDTGRGFTGYYQFTMKADPGFKHRLWLRVNTGNNLKGMALMVQQGETWTQLGVRTQNIGITRHFQALYFDVPEKWITSNQVTFRLVSKTGDEVNTYHLWMYRLDAGQGLSWAHLLGFSSGQEAGKVDHGLIPKGKNWKSPIVLAQHPEQSAMIIQRIGKGFLIRSELAIEDSVGILKSLLNGKTLEQMGESW